MWITRPSVVGSSLPSSDTQENTATTVISRTLRESLLLSLSSLLQRSVLPRPRQQQLAALLLLPQQTPQPCSETLVEWIWRHPRSFHFRRRGVSHDGQARLPPSRGCKILLFLLLGEQQPPSLLKCGQSDHGVLRPSPAEVPMCCWQLARTARLIESSLNTRTHAVSRVRRSEGCDQAGCRGVVCRQPIRHAGHSEYTSGGSMYIHPRTKPSLHVRFRNLPNLHTNLLNRIVNACSCVALLL